MKEAYAGRPIRCGVCSGWKMKETRSTVPSPPRPCRSGSGAPLACVGRLHPDMAPDGPGSWLLDRRRLGGSERGRGRVQMAPRVDLVIGLPKRRNAGTRPPHPTLFTPGKIHQSGRSGQHPSSGLPLPPTAVSASVFLAPPRYIAYFELCSCGRRSFSGSYCLPPGQDFVYPAVWVNQREVGIGTLAGTGPEPKGRPCCRGP